MDGTFYEGEFFNDMKQGKGTLTLPNGHKILGHFNVLQFECVMYL